MDFFNNKPSAHNLHEHSHTDEDTTDTEDDSGIAEDPEIPFGNFPNLPITNFVGQECNALSNFFTYW